MDKFQYYLKGYSPEREVRPPSDNECPPPSESTDVDEWDQLSMVSSDVSSSLVASGLPRTRGMTIPGVFILWRRVYMVSENF